jgi:hypothetical protein
MEVGQPHSVGVVVSQVQISKSSIVALDPETAPRHERSFERGLRFDSISK